MKYRLKESGEDSLVEYLRLQKIEISWVAKRIERSRMGVDNIIKGKTIRSNMDTIQKIADALKMVHDYDEQGIYFTLKNQYFDSYEKRESISLKLERAIEKVSELKEELRLLYIDLNNLYKDIKIED